MVPDNCAVDVCSQWWHGAPGQATVADTVAAGLAAAQGRHRKCSASGMHSLRSSPSWRTQARPSSSTQYGLWSEPSASTSTHARETLDLSPALTKQ